MPVGGIGAVHLQNSDFAIDICVQEFSLSLSFRYVEKNTAMFCFFRVEEIFICITGNNVTKIKQCEFSHK